MRFLFILFLALSPSVFAACETAACGIDTATAPYRTAGKLSGTLLVRHDGAIVARSFSLADDRWELPNSLGTIFAIASLSKGFVAATALKLIEQGKLKLDDKVADWLPEYPRRNLTRGGVDATVRDLLTHESGVPEAYDTQTIEKRLDRVDLSFTDMIGAVDRKGLHFTPHTRFEYSNTGYVLLGEIVRRASGTTSEIFLRENFLQPLGMESTTVMAPGLPTGTVARSYSLASGKRVDYETENGLVGIATSEVFADMNVYTNAPDLATWAEAITSGTVLSNASTQAMLTPNLGQYGYGWIIYHDTANRLAYEHAGDYGGFQSWIRRYPEAHLTVVWLSNQDMSDQDLSGFYEGVASAALSGTW